MGFAESQPSELNCFSVPQTLNFLQEDIKEMDQCVEEMLKYVGLQGVELVMKGMINDDGEILDQSPDACHQKRVEAAIEKKEFYQTFLSLAGRCASLTVKLKKLSPVLQGAVLDHESSFQTPEKLGTQGESLSEFLSSSGGDSDLFRTAGCKPSSLLSPSSESIESCYDESLEEVQPLRNLQNELHSSYLEDGDSENDKAEVLRLRKQIAELESCVSNSNQNALLAEELDGARKILQESEQEMEKLNQELRNETFKLQGGLDLVNRRVKVLEAELASERRLVSELQQTFNSERLQLLFDVSVLSDQQSLLLQGLEEAESKAKSLETQLKKCQLESLDMKTLHEAREKSLFTEIEELKVQLGCRSETISALNRNLDESRHKFDVLMVEKDETVAKLHNLTAELRHLFIQISEMEAHFNRLSGEHVELLAESEGSDKLVDELRVRVMELEEEVDRQKMVISEREEEKREAIRQLCVSLEHYRSGYHDLRQAFVGHKRQLATLAW